MLGDATSSYWREESQGYTAARVKTIRTAFITFGGGRDGGRKASASSQWLNVKGGLVVAKEKRLESKEMERGGFIAVI